MTLQIFALLHGFRSKTHILRHLVKAWPWLKFISKKVNTTQKAVGGGYLGNFLLRLARVDLGLPLILFPSTVDRGTLASLP